MGLHCAMRLYRSSILIVTCLTCASFSPSAASTVRRNLTPIRLEIAQVSSSTTTTKPSTLRPGTTGNEVKLLQTQLKQLGHYDGVIDGNYSENTQESVSKFQKAEGLTADGIAGAKTRERLQASVVNQSSLMGSNPNLTPKAQELDVVKQDWVWWLLVGLGGVGGFGALLYLVRRFLLLQNTLKAKTASARSIQADKNKVNVPLTQLQSHADYDYQEPAEHSSETVVSSLKELLPVEQPTRLAKLSIVDELIKDLHSPDPKQRRKAIWDLGQQGDSRAMQPLMDLLIDSDSQQRSLILAALSEIGTRTLNPMNRALAVSLQDESAEVRQNAIRDLTRIYDIMAQMSQMLCHALQDPNTEVQETARYALSQMNRIRPLPQQDSLPSLSESQEDDD
ncbi:MAG: peptidoglycan-binding protein [Nostocaceae cyanobacterium]|nr:peptidoglycan-binding protein [Nostocaceae cyanobacterium]